MSEHAWVLENAASYVADGLDPAERERLEEHIASCEQCAAARDEAREVDRTMQSLFASEQPGPALEDRLIRSLREAARPQFLRLPLARQISLGAAAVLLLGMLGVIIGNMIEQGNLPFPGTWGTEPRRDTMLAHQRLLFPYIEESGLPAEDRTRGAALPRSASFASENDIPNPTSKNADDLARETYEKAVAAMETLQRDETLKNAVTEMETLQREVSLGEGAESTSRYASRTFGRSGDNDGDGVGAMGASPGIASTGPGGMGMAGGGMGGGRGGAMLSGVSPFSGLVTDGCNSSGKRADDKSAEYYSYRSDLPTVAVLAEPNQPIAAPGGTQVSAVATHFRPADLAVLPKALRDNESEVRKEAGKNPEATGKPQFLMGDGTVRFISENVQPGTTVGKPAEDQKQDQPPAPVVAPRKVIRSGEIEFEIDSFDSAVEKITQITTEEGGIVATVNSEKLPNGKVRGSVVIRVPPERLDMLVLKLRALGELKSQKIGSQDVTKQYTDLESRLRAARAMEERLLEMIRTGKGEIKDLLQAEKELGVWRTKIEEMEGELRYYNNLIALSTLTLTLYEKEIRSPAAVTETERVQMGIEVEDVEQAHREALEAIAEANGRVTKSELKQHAAEQFSAVIQFEVAPDAGGPLRDRLRQLGHVARLEIDRLQQTEGGTGRPRDARSVRNDTQFFVSLYNVANIAPRETVHVNLACVDTEAAYKTILDRIEQAAGRVVSSNLSRQNSEKPSGSLSDSSGSPDSTVFVSPSMKVVR
ncbi:MAG: DUF4349 domain-containing protein [Planctomycetes bacterium]|nr:DUF4349 domain-containing protein [Planctomycetota bacterium]